MAGDTVQCPVCSLDDSAPPGEISADGHCGSCGRQVPSGRDHVELSLELLAGVTDRGLRHPRNEDAMALASAETAAGPVAIAVVCDGVSSTPRPDEASLAGAQAAVRRLLASVRRGDDPGEASLAAVRQAHEAMTILGSPSRAPSATYISAIVGCDAVTVCWLGDSRAYWLADGSGSQRLTTDDSLAEEMVARGEMTEAEAMASPQAHVITRWLGADVEAPEPHLTRFEPPGRGVVLVCSDGLWNYQTEAAGLAGLALPAAFHDPASAAGVLLSFALQAGGMDNITIVLVPFPLARPGSVTGNNGGGGSDGVPLPPGHLDGDGDRGPRLLQAGPGRHRAGRRRRAVPLPLRRTAFPARRPQMRIGRRSVIRGLAPEIDLAGPTADPGISRLRAVLIAAPDGSWAVLDPGSVNGTLVNGAEIEVGDRVPLDDGDRINLGAWTAITVHRALTYAHDH